VRRRRRRSQIESFAQLHEQQRGFHAFAADHEHREKQHAEKRRGTATETRGLQSTFDVAFHPSARTPHVNDHPGHRRGGQQRERTFQKFLVRGVEEEVPGTDADGERDCDAPVNGGRQVGPPGLAQVRETDGND